ASARSQTPNARRHRLESLRALPIVSILRGELLAAELVTTDATPWSHVLVIRHCKQRSELLESLSSKVTCRAALVSATCCTAHGRHGRGGHSPSSWPIGPSLCAKRVCQPWCAYKKVLSHNLCHTIYERSGCRPTARAIAIGNSWSPSCGFHNVRYIIACYEQRSRYRERLPVPHLRCRPAGAPARRQARAHSRHDPRSMGGAGAT